MSLPRFLRFAYHHGTEEVIRRGKKIFNAGGVQLMDVDHLLGQVRFRVRNDQYNTYYTVTVAKFQDEKGMSVRCQCPYNLGEICRHEVAALFQLNDLSAAGFFADTNITYDQSHTLVRMRQVTEELIAVFTAPQSLALARAWADERRASSIVTEGDRLSANVTEEGGLHPVSLRQNDERYFDTSCDCNEQTHPLCRHKAAVFLQILKERGPNFFRTMQNWDAMKEKLLALYGYSMKDELTGKFEFTYEDGRPVLKVLDQNIRKLAIVETPPPALPKSISSVPEPAPVAGLRPRIGIVADAAAPLFPFVAWRLVAGEAAPGAHQFAGPIESIDAGGYVSTVRYSTTDRDAIPIVRKLAPEELGGAVAKALPFAQLPDEATQLLSNVPLPEVADAAWEYLLPRYQRLLGRFAQHPLCFVRMQGQPFTGARLIPVECSPAPAQPALRVLIDRDDVLVTLQWTVGGRHIPTDDVTMLNAGLIMAAFTLYATSNIASLKVVESFLPDGEQRVPATEWPAYLENSLMSLRSTLPVHFDDTFIEQTSTVKPHMRLYLSEREKVLVLQPAFMYGTNEIRWGYEGDITIPHNGRVRIIRRQHEAEEDFLQSIQRLHSDMKRSVADHFFYLAASEVLGGSWFFRFMDEMREAGVAVLGFESLKRLRISTHKPKTEVRVSSGIDWFDTEVNVAFGDQHITIADIRRALQNGQHFVPLHDGSIGLLPEDWLKKYGLLMKMGEERANGSLRLRKFHFSVLDALLDEVDEESIQQELEEKKAQLSAIIDRDFSDMAPPPQLRADLRPYQHAGYQWLAFLQEARWGGILADDMGLGKTVQALSYLQHFANGNPAAHFLVVCPTTLMYNWEAEIKKFTPELRHFIHHGPKRTGKPADFDPYHIIITTYGTMRSDIRWLKDITFDYAILDESQAIKNPQSQVAKSSLLINARHKLALSGTPVQNNTFDLYAQMNFLNPGLLGSREFFANEFATPIDKFREEDATRQLRQLIYPFMLRRTKEQVAKDLPEKTETILWCEMGPEQRRVYDAYRNTYASELLGMIDERGIERAQFHILQGLTRLRQICDSPAILKDADAEMPNHSIKADELLREITENVGNHKALVFSQFLGMLAIIRKGLEAASIPYAYFDGSSSALEREAAVRMFQDDEASRVFLISLKAGGVGLNLTAADYVYLVDPWWNPAVEQQAIDRTHRIGQTKAIFAYRLICKETIEEKMLILQERKRALAADLVTDDSAMMKRLTRDDIVFLLS